MTEAPALEALITGLMLLYGLMIACLAGFYLRDRIGRPIRQAYTRKLCECLQPQDRLPSMVFPEIEYAFNRRLLVRLLSTLSPMLEGVESRILRLIVHDNGLDRHILRECRLQGDRANIHSLSVFVSIPIPESLAAEWPRFLESRNRELRMVALLGWLNQEPSEIPRRLAEWPHGLSERECANIYALARRHCLPAGEAEKLLRSSNPSVVRFGKMVLKLNGYREAER